VEAGSSFVEAIVAAEDDISIMNGKSDQTRYDAIVQAKRMVEKEDGDAAFRQSKSFSLNVNQSSHASIEFQRDRFFQERYQPRKDGLFWNSEVEREKENSESTIVQQDITELLDDEVKNIISDNSDHMLKAVQDQPNRDDAKWSGGSIYIDIDDEQSQSRRKKDPRVVGSGRTSHEYVGVKAALLLNKRKSHQQHPQRSPRDQATHHLPASEGFENEWNSKGSNPRTIPGNSTQQTEHEEEDDNLDVMEERRAEKWAALSRDKMKQEVKDSFSKAKATKIRERIRVESEQASKEADLIEKLNRIREARRHAENDLDAAIGGD